MLNGIYPSSEYLRLRFGFDSNKCIFCDDIETMDHLFFLCMYVDALWSDIHDWLYPKVRYLGSFTLKDIIYGLVMNNSKDAFLVNSILMMGKFYIHKSKYLKVKPAFCAFHNEFVLYTKALKVMKRKNAINLFSIIIEYDLQEKP